MTKQLGHISQKYESGNLKSDAISNTPGDPGGKSYGLYQLAINTGTLKVFVNKSQFKTKLTSVPLGSIKFDKLWKELSKDSKFLDEQHSFIKKTHYDPVRKEATAIGFLDTPAINEALWSMGVQHGKAKQLVARAGRVKGHYNKIEKHQITALYDIRKAYIQEIALSPQLKRSLAIRFNNEERDVLKLVGANNVLYIKDVIKEEQPLPTSCEKLSQSDSKPQESIQKSSQIIDPLQKHLQDYKNTRKESLFSRILRIINKG